MISGKLLRPIIVIALAAFELSTPTDAEARTSTDACGIEYFIQCGNMSSAEIHAYCNAACPTWIMATCNTDTGALTCLYDPW